MKNCERERENQNSEFGIQSESEAGRWIASPAARNDRDEKIFG